MKKRNVLWLMSDQHNASCVGYRSHPNVRTPNLDRIAANGVDFTGAFANNPICSPSRLCFITGRYAISHGYLGNEHADLDSRNPDSLACLFRRSGYQTGLFGKAHMIRAWDEEGFERIRYTDLCDATRGDPFTNHYFKMLHDNGLADSYEEGSPKPGQVHTMDGSGPARLPYEYSIEHFTGEETLRFLEERDTSRPFFIHMSFQRPHAPIAPAAEYFDLYNPDEIVLPDSAGDYLENRFAGKPRFQQELLKNGCSYPLADPDPARLRRVLASYYALITCIDMEIGRVLDKLEQEGELENTVIFYTADHGDFAGEHGLFHKNLGMYDSIQRIPFLLSYPGGPKGLRLDGLVESIDFYPTLCELCGLEAPKSVQGVSLLPMIENRAPGKDAVFAEHRFPKYAVHSIRTADYRLNAYDAYDDGELYDHSADPGEVHNLFDDPDYLDVRAHLTQRLLQHAMRNALVRTDARHDAAMSRAYRYMPTKMIHKSGAYWSTLQAAYRGLEPWPPKKDE